MSKAIFFDLDGTLTDSGEGIINCAAFALETLGLDVPDRVTMRCFVGPPLRDTFMKFGVREDQTEEAIRIYRSRYLPIGKYENMPYPGVIELLERLRAAGHYLYVATSKPESTAMDVINHFDIAKYFTLICGATMDGSREEKSQVIAYLLSLIDSPSQAIMVGDTAFDVTGAAAHGIPTIGVSWGYGSVEDMERSGAIGIAHTMDELYEMLTK